MGDTAEGLNIFASASALRAARRGNYSLIEARAKAGAALMPEELDALDQRDRGVKLKRGQKDPQIDAETIVLCRWLHEVEGEALEATYAFVAAMTGRTAGAVKAVIRRAARSDGLGANIADHAFNRHCQLRETPPPLMARDANWKCTMCSRYLCNCHAAPRPEWRDGVGAITARALISLSKI